MRFPTYIRAINRAISKRVCGDVGRRVAVIKPLLSIVAVLFSVAPLSSTAENRPVIVVTLSPLAALVRDIGHDHFDVVTLIEQHQDPHHYALKPSDLRRLRRADALLWLGATFEPYLVPQLQRASVTQQLSVESIKGLQWLPLGGYQHNEHDTHDTHQRHSSEVTAQARDPHIWLSIKNRPILIKAMTEWLASSSSETRIQQAIRARGEKLMAEWLQHAPQWQQFVHTLRGSVLVDHNAFAYLIAEHDWALAGVIQGQHDIKPSLKHLLKLKRAVQSGEVACLIVHPATDVRLIRKVDSEQRLTRITINPLLGGDDEGKREGGEQEESAVWFESLQAMEQLFHTLAQCAEQRAVSPKE